MLLIAPSLRHTLVSPGEEAHKLASLPLTALTPDAAMLDILLRWGVKTCEDLAALPERA